MCWLIVFITVVITSFYLCEALCIPTENHECAHKEKEHCNNPCFWKEEGVDDDFGGLHEQNMYHDVRTNELVKKMPFESAIQDYIGDNVLWGILQDLHVGDYTYLNVKNLKIAPIKGDDNSRFEYRRHFLQKTSSHNGHTGVVRFDPLDHGHDWTYGPHFRQSYAKMFDTSIVRQIAVTVLVDMIVYNNDRTTLFSGPKGGHMNPNNIMYWVQRSGPKKFMELLPIDNGWGHLLLEDDTTQNVWTNEVEMKRVTKQWQKGILQAVTNIHSFAKRFFKLNEDMFIQPYEAHFGEMSPLLKWVINRLWTDIFVKTWRRYGIAISKLVQKKMDNIIDGQFVILKSYKEHASWHKVQKVRDLVIQNINICLKHFKKLTSKKKKIIISAKDILEDNYYNYGYDVNRYVENYDKNDHEHARKVGFERHSHLNPLLHQHEKMRKKSK